MIDHRGGIVEISRRSMMTLFIDIVRGRERQQKEREKGKKRYSSSMSGRRKRWWRIFPFSFVIRTWIYRIDLFASDEDRVNLFFEIFQCSIFRVKVHSTTTHLWRLMFWSCQQNLFLFIVIVVVLAINACNMLASTMFDTHTEAGETGSVCNCVVLSCAVVRLHSHRSMASLFIRRELLVVIKEEKTKEKGQYYFITLFRDMLISF